MRQNFNDAFILGTMKTLQQDAESALNELVEIAIRALSPGINDRFTALTCIDWLSDALSDLAERKTPTPFYYDSEDKLRIIAKSLTFACLLDTAFSKLRHYAAATPMVTTRMLEAIAIIGTHAQHERDRNALIRHADLIAQAARLAISDEADRNAIEEYYTMTVNALKKQT
ncbi:MAG: hypothetical protein Kow0099_06560 [Candidatus Abyssubacteria bacterium]